MTDLFLDGVSYAHPEDPGEPSTGVRRLSITDDEAEYLTVFAAGRHVLEIGTGLGVSTRALARDAAYMVTHDIDPWVHETIWPTLEDVWCVKERASLAQFGPFDLVFIDADHGTLAVVADIAFAESLEPELIVCHDTNYDSVRNALIPLEEWTLLPTAHGLGIKYLRHV